MMSKSREKKMNYLYTITTVNEGTGDFNRPPLDTFYGTADEANSYAEEHFSEHEWYVLDEDENNING